VSEFGGSSWTTCTTADGLADNVVWAIAIDGTDHRWFGTGGGASGFFEFFPGFTTHLPIVLGDRG
jgi:hypothetical protein